MRALAGIVAFAAVGGLALDDGGYFPVSAGRASVALLGLLALALAAGRPARPGRLELAALAGMVALLGWTALSWAWSVGPPEAVDEAQRTLVYAAALALALLFGRPLPLAAGALAGAALASAVDLAGGEAVGYANGMAALAAVGAVLGAGLALSADGPLARGAAAGSLGLTVPVVVLAESQGVWAALALGAAVGLALRRPLPALALLAVVAALAYAKAPADDRPEYWDATLATVADHPVLGSGAGTWERGWLLHRDVAREARDAHSLYLETLAELGPLGLALLLAALAPPLVAAYRVRRDPLAPWLAAAYATWLAHAAVDWDWELPAVSLAGLAAGAALLLLARPGAEPLPGRARAAAAASAAVLLAAAAVGLAGARALAEARSAQRENDPARAAERARDAAQLMPWSAEARLALGVAEDDPGPVREALDRDPTLWRAWIELARLTEGRERAEAAAEAARLNPLGPGPG